MEIKTLLVTATLVLVASFGNNKAASVADKPPLYLTPLIENRTIYKARQLSLIKDDFFPKSFSGLITVDKHHGNHLFFWFFPAESSYSESPLVVWLNSGPGISSMVGLFLENGPLRLDNATKWCKKWPKSWAQNFNMLYIDQPVGVGYSYTEDKRYGWRDTMDGHEKDFYEFIKQFYIMFPEYMRRDLYIGGQSDAGIYVPAFAYYLHTEILVNRSCIPLKGIYLGKPLFDPITQGRESARFFEVLGAMSKKQANDFQRGFDDSAKYGRFRNFMIIYENMDWSLPYFLTVGYTFMNEYFTLRKVHLKELKALMNTNKMRDSVHVGNLTFQENNILYNLMLDKNTMVSQKSKLAILMDSYKVLIYNGDLDGYVSSMMVEAGLMSTNWSLQAEYNNSVRYIWWQAEKLVGFYTKTGQFCRVVIRQAELQIPFDQSDVSHKMIEHFVKLGCIQ